MPVQDGPAKQTYASPYVMYVVLLLSIVNVFNYIDRMALAVLLPHIQADLKLTDGQLGLLIGLAFALFYAICGIPIARWADRGIRRNIIALALTTWSVMTALSGLAQNFYQLFLARVGVGAGEAGGVPPAQSILCDYVPLQRRPGVLAFHNFGLVAGTMCGMALAGWLGEVLGWRWTLVVLGVPGVLLAVIVRLTLREPIRGGVDAQRNVNRNDRSLRETIKTLWSCRTYRLLMVMTVLNGFVQYGMNQWWPTFYSRSFGLSLSSVGVYLGTAIGVGSGIGLLIGGLAGNAAAERNVRWPLVIGAAATFLALPAAFASLFVVSDVGSIVLVAFTALLWNVSTGPFLAAVYGVTSPSVRATAGAFMIFFTSVLGFGLGPFCVGLLSDALTPSLGVEALRYALLAPVGFIPVMAAVLFSASKTLPNDLRASTALLQRELEEPAPLERAIAK